MRKALTLMMGVCMAMMPGAISAYADDSTPDTKWDDYAATDFAGGTGTKIDPYLIETPQQLAKVSKDVAARETYKGAGEPDKGTGHLSAFSFATWPRFPKKALKESLKEIELFE